MKSIPLFLLILYLLMGCTEPNQPRVSLYLAVQRGDLDQVKRHIYWGSDINQLNPDGTRALHVGAAQGKQVIVDILLKSGAGIDLQDQTGHTAIYYAILNGHIRLANLMLKQGASLEPSLVLLDAAAAGTTNRDVVRYLVTQGADLENRDEHGQTALLTAVEQNNHRLLRHLIDQGADVNVRNTKNQSALWIAKQQNLSDIAQLLQRNGAQDTQRN